MSNSRKKRKRNLYFFFSEGWMAVHIRKYSNISQNFNSKAMLTICLPHCLTSTVRYGRVLKSNCKNCSCKNCMCAGHDGQIMCQAIAPWCSAQCVYIKYTYTHMKKHIKKENVRGYEKLPQKFRLVVHDWGTYPLNMTLNKPLSSDKGRNYQESSVTYLVYEST